MATERSPIQPILMVTALFVGLLPAGAVSAASPASEKTVAAVSQPKDIPLGKLEAKMAPVIDETPPPAPSRASKTMPPQEVGPSPSGSTSKGDASEAPTASQSPAAAFENYPIIARMEIITFGNARPTQRVDQRLNALEDAVFKKSFSDQTLFDRTQRLKASILGVTDEPAEGPALDDIGLKVPAPAQQGNISYLDEIAQKPENQKEADRADWKSFALELVNFARTQAGVPPLEVDELAARMADEHVADLAARNLLSHASSKGENPDLRYTTIGGSDTITESIVSLKSAEISGQHLSKSIVAQTIKAMLSRQDDRDALLSPDATGLGFSLGWMAGQQNRLVACTEISTKHGIMQPILSPVSIGDKIEVKGLVQQPYKFDRISLAWEGSSVGMPSAADEGEEALPYFPPLDYIAFAAKAEHDYEKTMATLRTVGIIAAIAGGVFMPPVALAAPLIAASGSMGEPKALSDIPVHGGVKLEGLTFTGKVPFSNGGKEGIYYVTVWASNGRGGKSVPISRRAIQVGSQSVAGSDDGSVKKKHAKRESKKKALKGAEIEP